MPPADIVWIDYANLLTSIDFELYQTFNDGVLTSKITVTFSLCLLLFSQPVVSRLLVTPWSAAHQASLSLTISHSLPKFMFIVSVMPSSHLILWCPLLLLPSTFPSTRDFSKESSVHIRWPKYGSFNVSPSSDYSGLISLKIDWFDLLAVQMTFRSLLQHHGSKASIFWHSASSTVRLSQLYVPTGKTIHSLAYTDLHLILNWTRNSMIVF